MSSSTIRDLRTRSDNPIQLNIALNRFHVGRAVQVADADRFAGNVLPVVNSVRSSGIIDLRGIAPALNDPGVSRVGVKNILDRTRAHSEPARP